MNTRKIKENLGRIKTCCLRGEAERALFLAIGAFKELGGQTAPMDMRGDFRTALTELLAIPEIKKMAGKGLSYAPGSEKAIAQALAQIYRKLSGQENEEEYQAALQRKLNLDRRFNDGKRFLAERKIAEAEACFTDALKYFRDEAAIFGMMARAMLEAGEPVRALGHVRAGLKFSPDDAALLRLAQDCAAQRK